MSAYIDFAALKEQVLIEDVAKWLNLELKPSGHQLRGECPACREGGARALAITPQKRVFFCFAEKTGGDCIKLVAHVRGIGQRDAAGEIAKAFLTAPSRERATAPSPREATQESLRPLDYLEHEHPAVEAVGFDPGDAKALGIGYAGKGLMRGTVAIPIRLSDGTLVGYVGATELRLPKSFHLQRRVVPFQKKSA